MKKISFFLENWFGWICLVFLARFILYLSIPEIKPPQQTHLEILLSRAIHTKDKEIQSLVFQSVYEIAKKSSQSRLLVESLLNEKLSSPGLSQETKELFNGFREDPYFILKMTLESLSSFGIQDFQHLAFFILLFFTFLIVFLVPCLFCFFLGKKSLYKIFGSQGVKAFLFLNLLLWSSVVYCSLYLQRLWLSQIFLLFPLLLVLYRMLQSGLLALFWEENEKNLQRCLFAFFLVMLFSFSPYILQKEKREINQSSLLLAVERSRKENRQDLAPLIADTLQQCHTFSIPLQETLIKALGDIGSEENISHLIGFVSSPEIGLQKSALEAISKILKKEKKD